ncbi:Scr1 family TA system antitoxin-like transcriptional regulator [Cryptosporangium sp. NPDC051539]|uniref:Scr1 family TA system antitoxin-like transcriptional regulator n=1 Tax=Cryptosporangium sp. NPDC051539 TaxID=3363962 RepID=UPI003791B036
MPDFDSDDPPVVYLENISGALFLDKAYHVQGHSLAFDHLRATALSPADTVTLLRGKADAMKAQAVREGAE